ncbi:Xaa-Pro aminopeptidase [Skeletonema marinoi]|uniref:Xaa-Pro aminopeptidase n=1 Tax=Skeletonema marinoi TaxID=267567 RepID=A0AAD9D766_9STRA|nr:Xaa-Pro aminopeptidase [Skeletonema marinoi]
MTLSFLAITVAATTSTTLKKQSRNSKFSTLALFFVATSASSAARAFSSSTPTFLPRHHQQSLSRRSGASSTLNNSVIYNTRGGSLASIVGKKLSLSRRFSSTQIEQEVVSEMDEVKAAASKISAADKLALMREKMEENGVDVYIIPSDDPHLSEYVPAAYMRRGYLTDFHGSAGTALVTKDAAYLWTDSRYFNEASLRLDAGHWTLMKQGQPKVLTIPKFLADLATSHYTNSKPLKVGMDAYVHAASFAKELNEAFADAAKDMEGDVPPTIAAIDTLDGKQNVVDSIWEGRPDLPKNPFRVHPMKYAGMTVQDKVTKIRSEMTEKKATMTVFSALDDIAYLFNVRCMGDVETCPIGIAYATISKDEVALHCDPEKVAPADVSEHLKEAGVTVKSYGDIVSDIESHLSAGKKNKVWLDNGRSNYALSRVIPEAALIDAQNPVTAMKGCKNEAEMEGMRQAHIVDGAAMANFMAWLENAIVVEGRSVSEVEIDEVLTGFRAKQPGFKEVSFPTIAGVGANGAIVHYRAAEGSDLLKYLDRTQPILIDSGGQYEYGTTDVTRTWHFAEKPDDEFREVYTRVLKGNIGVDSMIFPENTPGFVLDVFARKALWEIGKDYGHGTGHGVGAALNVHEGPHSISPRWGNKEVLKAGMVTSNEPGYYEDGNFGIRIENLLEIVEISSSDDANNGEEPANKKQKVAAEGKKFLKFGKLTLIPIQKNLIKVEIMTEDELNWLDSYHQEVLQKVKPLLEEGTPAMEWLVKSCEPIKRD